MGGGGFGVVFSIKSKKSPLHFSLTGLQSRGHSICTAEQLSQKTGAITKAYSVPHDCIMFAVSTNSERSGLTCFIADLLKVCYQKAQTKLHLGLIGNTYNRSE